MKATIEIKHTGVHKTMTVDERLVNYLLNIVDDVKCAIGGFNEFTSEEIVFALCEWGKFYRPDYEPFGRYVYLWEKAMLFKHGKDYTGCVVEVPIYLPNKPEPLYCEYFVEDVKVAQKEGYDIIFPKEEPS